MGLVRALDSPGAPSVAQMVKNPPAMRETWVLSLGGEDPLEEAMATHSSVLAWRIPWQRSLVGCGSWGRKESDTTEPLTLSRGPRDRTLAVTSMVEKEMHVTRGCSVIMQVWVTPLLSLSRATPAFTSILIGEDARNQRTRPWSDLLFPNTCKSKHIATEERKGSLSLCRLIKGSRGSPGLGRYRGRKEIAAGSQSDVSPPTTTKLYKSVYNWQTLF